MCNECCFVAFSVSIWSISRFPQTHSPRMILKGRGPMQSIPLTLPICQSTLNWLQSVLKYASCAAARATPKKDLPLRLGWTVPILGVSNAEKGM